MADIGAVLEVLAKNSKDIGQVVDEFGGIEAFVRASPALFRIWRTIAAHAKDNPEAAAERAEKTLYYNAETMERVKAFQRQYNLEVDGIVGRETWTKVEDLLPIYK